MDGRIIDGERWIAERVKFLEERLGEELGEGERRAVEAELELLAKERGLMPGGVRAGRTVRWIRRRT